VEKRTLDDLFDSVELPRHKKPTPVDPVLDADDEPDLDALVEEGDTDSPYRRVLLWGGPPLGIGLVWGLWLIAWWIIPLLLLLALIAVLIWRKKLGTVWRALSRTGRTRGRGGPAGNWGSHNQRRTRRGGRANPLNWRRGGSRGSGRKGAGGAQSRPSPARRAAAAAARRFPRAAKVVRTAARAARAARRAHPRNPLRAAAAAARAGGRAAKHAAGRRGGSSGGSSHGGRGKNRSPFGRRRGATPAGATPSGKSAKDTKGKGRKDRKKDKTTGKPTKDKKGKRGKGKDAVHDDDLDDWVDGEDGVDEDSDENLPWWKRLGYGARDKWMATAGAVGDTVRDPMGRKWVQDLLHPFIGKGDERSVGGPLPEPADPESRADDVDYEPEPGPRHDAPRTPPPTYDDYPVDIEEKRYHRARPPIYDDWAPPHDDTPATSSTRPRTYYDDSIPDDGDTPRTTRSRGAYDDWAPPESTAPPRIPVTPASTANRGGTTVTDYDESTPTSRSGEWSETADEATRIANRLETKAEELRSQATRLERSENLTQAMGERINSLRTEANKAENDANTWRGRSASYTESSDSELAVH
jgi:hypothetical protein